MRDTISLVGSGQTRFGEWWDKSLRDLMSEAVAATIENSGLNPLEIDLVIVGNMLGETLSDQAQLGAMAASLLPHHPPALRTEAACGSGGVALHTACAMLESGRAQTVLVIGAEKMTDVPTDIVSAGLMAAADAEKDAISGLTFPGIFGLIANRYMYDHGLTREQLNAVSAKHHAAGAANPFAQFRKAIPAEAISKSAPVADPLCLLDCSPVSDGAAAVILSTKHESNLRMAASQLATDHVSLTDRPSLTSFTATQSAMEQALTEANITRQDIGCIELHDCFSIAAIINVEDLGFAQPGHGIELYLEDPVGVTVNHSGGLKACGHPVGATGVKQLIDVSKQLKESEKQFGLAHNFGGTGATCTIHLLERA